MRRDIGGRNWTAKQRVLRVKRMHREEVAFRLELRLQRRPFRDVEPVVFYEEQCPVQSAQKKNSW